MFPRLTVLLGVILVSLLMILIAPAKADEIEELQKQINELNKAREQSVAATKPLEGQLNSLKMQLSQIQSRLQTLTYNIKQKEKELQVREDKLVLQQALLNSRVRSYYIRSFLTTPLLVILSPASSGDLFRELSYRQAATREDQRVITSVTEDMIDLMAQKEKLEKDKASLASLQAQVDKNADFLAGEIKKAKDYQADLSSKIADLSAKQQSILAAKSGNFTTSVGEVPLADDPNSRPDFNPGFSPAFAMFSFGAYTHRNGMSQYGAKGRAEGGQSAEQILSAYYPGASLNKGYAVPSTINVTGHGSMAFEETYLMRIYEMPNSFPMEALKAQAVAARTYAIRQGGTICATESCQVYKPFDKGGAWAEAVRATRGWVLEGGANAQYSSTTGGYGNNSGWDTKCGSQGCWPTDAYEKIAGSPWFYKGWYKERDGSSCGRSHPWLNAEEMADILNAWVVLIKHGQSDDRIVPTGGCWGGNPYSLGELKSKAASLSVGFGRVSSSSPAVFSGSGNTASVTFDTDQGSVTINGADFKRAFNLRAPGYISIKSPLFNIEKR